MGLFGEIPLRIIGVTGPIGSGKTLFGLSIHPEAKLKEHAGRTGPAKTLVFDDEYSSATYENVRHFERIGMDEDERFAGKTPEETWEAITEFFDSLGPGRYDVVFIDTIERLEFALETWLEKNPQYGHTNNQYARAKGIYFGDLKKYLKQWISQHVMPKVEVLAWAAHERAVWANDKPVRGQTQPYGKRTWTELAQVYLKLERKIVAGKTKVPEIPVATHIKSARLSRVDEKGDLHPILPPGIEDCTPDKIRQYIAAPADWGKLKKAEQAPKEEPLTDDEKLLISAEKAENERVAGETALSVLDARERAAKAARDVAAQARQRQATQGQSKPEDLKPTPVSEPEPESDNGFITEPQARHMRTMRDRVVALEPDYAAKFEAAIRKRAIDGSDDLTKVPASEASVILGGLNGKLNNLESAQAKN